MTKTFLVDIEDQDGQFRLKLEACCCEEAKRFALTKHKSEFLSCTVLTDQYHFDPDKWGSRNIIRVLQTPSLHQD